MQYMLLIYWDEKLDEGRTPDEQAAVFERYNKFTAKVREAGLMKYADALESVSDAQCVAVRDGKSMITDGPFAETKEQLGGLYILECESQEEALAYAAEIPHAELGRVEVRPIMNY